VGNVDVVSEDTFYGFYKRYLDKKGTAERVPSAVREDFYAEIVGFLIGGDDLNLQMPILAPNDEDKLLGHEAKKIFGTPQGWLDLFTSDSRNLLMECLSLVKSTKRINKNMDLKLADGAARVAAVEMVLEDHSGIVRINLRPPDGRINPAASQLEKIESLDAVVIDYNLLSDPNALMAGLKKGCDESGIRTGPEGPKIIVMAEDGRNIDFEKLSRSNVYGFLYKPIEVRRFLFLIGQAIESPFTVYNFENIGWKTDIIPAKIARDAKISEIAEFGSTILSEQQLKPGTMLYLFRSIFSNAPDQNLCVRVYYSEENASEKGTYLNSVIYFGITDAFLKFTRTYIRETYASKKAKEGGAQ
jgi:hypothetical protein